MTAAVGEVDDQTDDHPNDEPRPRVGGQSIHQIAAKDHAQRRNQPECWCAERPVNLWIGESQHEHAGADNGEREQRADGHEFAQKADGKQTCHQHGSYAGENLRNPRRAKFRMHRAEHRRQQSVLRHRVENSRLAE